MDTPRICPSCAKSMAADAPQGICPSCLLMAGLASRSGGCDPGRAFVPPPIEVIQRRFPQLEILALIGRGGMGAVYKARQPALDRLVALKVLPAREDDRDFAARFTREARALARLSHPNIIAVHEFGEVEGFHYFVMELVDGPNLRQLQQAGKLLPRQALQIIPQICEALQFAHDAGIVHRDIKPENVLIDRKGRVRIADFGLAKIVGCDPEDFRLTGVRDVMGTPHYMAPEQVEKPQEVDHRADIYSLGVVFYEMLTGELPLGKFAPPSHKAAVDARWDEVILRALEKDPHLRYQQASEIKTRVEKITQHPEPVVVIEPVMAPAIPANAGTFRLIAAMVVGLLVVGGLVVLRKILTPGGGSVSTPVAMEAATSKNGLSAGAGSSESDLQFPVRAKFVDRDGNEYDGTLDDLLPKGGNFQQHQAVVQYPDDQAA
jgi:tRNA A-37 threonylcarbamoyl transferase component Bud32